MERPRKRKPSFLESNTNKRYKDEFSYIIHLKFTLLQKTLDNEKLNKKIITLEKKLAKIEKYNSELRTKNSKLENELLEFKEEDKNNICQKLENLEFCKKIDYSHTYIN